MSDSIEPKFEKDTVIKELEQRRKKQWDIFSWVSTLLTSMIGGVIAIETLDDAPQITSWHRIELMAAALIICAYSVCWVGVNILYEEAAVKELRKLGESLPQPSNESKIIEYLTWIVGYIGTIIALTIATTFTIWTPLK